MSEGLPGPDDGTLGAPASPIPPLEPRRYETDRIAAMRTWVAQSHDKLGPLAPEPTSQIDTNNRGWWSDVSHLLAALDWTQGCLKKWYDDARRLAGERDGYMLLLDRLATAYKADDKPGQTEALVAILNAFDAEQHPNTLNRPEGTETCPTCHGWSWVPVGESS